MRIGVLLTFLLLVGGFLGSSVYQSGQGLDGFTPANVLVMAQSAWVILALLAPAFVLLGVLVFRGLGHVLGWGVPITALMIMAAATGVYLFGVPEFVVVT